MDITSNRMIHRVLPIISGVFNNLLRGDFRFQALPELFDLWSDGIDLVVFEEFGAGARALHFENQLEERRKLLKDPKYRKWFRGQWRNPFIPKVFHRKFSLARVLECPDKSLEGKTFAEIATEQKSNVVDVFLDLVARYDKELRWYTQMGNERPGPLGRIINSGQALIGFSDAGAHLRNMAHYNFPLRMLKLVHDSHKAGQPIMSLEKAVWRLTGELADWHRLDAGYLRQGDRADLVIIDPEYLDESLEEIHEASMPAFGNYRRLVRRNNATVPAVFVNGRLAVENGEPLNKVGKEKGFGQFLRARPA